MKNVVKRAMWWWSTSSCSHCSWKRLIAHEIGKVFSVPRTMGTGYIYLLRLHQLGTEDARVGDEQRNLRIPLDIVQPDWSVTLKVKTLHVELLTDKISEPTNSPALIS